MLSPGSADVGNSVSGALMPPPMPPPKPPVNHGLQRAGSVIGAKLNKTKKTKKTRRKHRRQKTAMPYKKSRTHAADGKKLCGLRSTRPVMWTAGHWWIPIQIRRLKQLQEVIEELWDGLCMRFYEHSLMQERFERYITKARQANRLNCHAQWEDFSNYMHGLRGLLNMYASQVHLTEDMVKTLESFHAGNKSIDCKATNHHDLMFKSRAQLKVSSVYRDGLLHAVSACIQAEEVAQDLKLALIYYACPKASQHYTSYKHQPLVLTACQPLPDQTRVVPICLQAVITNKVSQPHQFPVQQLNPKPSWPVPVPAKTLTKRLPHRPLWPAFTFAGKPTKSAVIDLDPDS